MAAVINTLGLSFRLQQLQQRSPHWKAFFNLGLIC